MRSLCDSSHSDAFKFIDETGLAAEAQPSLELVLLGRHIPGGDL